MEPVFFTFRPDVSPEERTRVVETLRSWPELTRAMPLHPGNSHPLLSRMYYATLRDERVRDAAISKLQATDGVVDVSGGPQRHLV